MPLLKVREGKRAKEMEVEREIDVYC